MKCWRVWKPTSLVLALLLAANRSAHHRCVALTCLHVLTHDWPSAINDCGAHTHKFTETKSYSRVSSQQMLNNSTNGKSMGRNNVSKQTCIVPANAWVCVCGHTFTHTCTDWWALVLLHDHCSFCWLWSCPRFLSVEQISVYVNWKHFSSSKTRCSKYTIQADGESATSISLNTLVMFCYLGWC